MSWMSRRTGAGTNVNRRAAKDSACQFSANFIISFPLLIPCCRASAWNVQMRHVAQQSPIDLDELTADVSRWSLARNTATSATCSGSPKTASVSGPDLRSNRPDVGTRHVRHDEPGKDRVADARGACRRDAERQKLIAPSIRRPERRLTELGIDRRDVDDAPRPEPIMGKAYLQATITLCWLLR
jgi:hypothetical protein